MLHLLSHLYLQRSDVRDARDAMPAAAWYQNSLGLTEDEAITMLAGLYKAGFPITRIMPAMAMAVVMTCSSTLPAAASLLQPYQAPSSELLIAKERDKDNKDKEERRKKKNKKNHKSPAESNNATTYMVRIAPLPLK